MKTPVLTVTVLVDTMQEAKRVAGEWVGMLNLVPEGVEFEHNPIVVFMQPSPGGKVLLGAYYTIDVPFTPEQEAEMMGYALAW